MAKKPRRKRLYYQKGVRHNKKTSNVEKERDDLFNPEDDTTSEEPQPQGKVSQTENQAAVPDMDHESVTSGSENCSHGTDASSEAQTTASTSEPSQVESEVAVTSATTEELLLQVKIKLELFQRRSWMCIADKDKLHLVKVSLQRSACIQRSVVFYPDGNLECFVHSKPINCDSFSGKTATLPLKENTVNLFVDRAAAVVESMDQMSICAGYDDVLYQPGWSTCPFGEVDRNIFAECRYVETFRALNCSMLVPSKKWRCQECQKLYGPLRRRTKAAAAKEHHKNTANVFLTEEQRLNKLKSLRTEADNLKKKNYRLQERMQEVIKKESVQVSPKVGDDLSEILRDANVTPAQSIFLQQQIKASQQKKACGMRWHPTMIRFALAIHLTSPTAYDLLRQTGMVKLPHSNTLFDYSHVRPIQEGVDRVVLESVQERVRKFPEKHKKYHVLMMDEMYICQNLVFQKSSGQMIGYTSLDTIESEMKILENLIDATEPLESENTIASKVLVYMIKGVSNGIKEVVATYAVSNLSANQLKDWTWHVIGDLEIHGVAVVAVICDGSAVNRAFIKKHKPATQHQSGIIFDTWNRASRGRKLYFISDVPHLLKTARNCLLNSRWDNRKSRRKMVKNGKKVTWDFVIKLYDEKNKKSLRKSYKLNAQNVYPDSYARMKVNLAGQVLSNTVAKDLQSQGWFDASETVIFIDHVNRWFDCLNGAHSTQGIKTRNENLNPYTSKEDSRFDILEDFLKYLDEWQREAESGVDQSMNESTAPANNTLVADSPDCDVSEIENAVFNPATDTPAGKRILSRETLEGMRITTLAFKPLVHFLLEEGVSFINARIFTQDPLEQHFSKVRAGQGGSTNPNLFQVLNRIRALHTVGQLGMRKRKGNSGQEAQTVEVTHEPLQKRKFVRVPKLDRIKE
ncbi:Transposable element P transposase [Frankliniella fusca]|uniref:Transposable element P transposase n=1 Tax=Frankliniella fusca TaxID=407009 RepID=A0AAE1LK19_9NEOP|nr:Transposable element P transposase [Frankliniella fusca]